MSKSKRTRWESAEINAKTIIDYRNRLTELALNVFEWVNVPDTINTEFLEKKLFYEGYCIYFRDDIIGDLTLTGSLGGRLNVYDEPLYRQVISGNGYNKQLSHTNSVIIYNNARHTPTFSTIELFAKRLYEIERAIDVNVKGQKTPVIILCNEKQRLTMQNLFMQYDGNEPFIFGDKELDLSGISSIKTDSPFVADKLEVLKHNVWNESLTFLGIENSNQDKKERLVTDEVSGNAGHVEAQRNAMLVSRQRAAERINKMFNLDISVKFRSSIQSDINLPFDDLDDMDILNGREGVYNYE